MVFLLISSNRTKKHGQGSLRANVENNWWLLLRNRLQRFFLDLVLKRSLKEKQAGAC
jgi:hypothetical protein